MELPEDKSKLLVIVEGLFDDYYVAIENFAARRWKNYVEGESVLPKDGRIRSYMRLLLYDPKTGQTWEEPSIVRSALQAVGKWVDELPLSVVFGREAEPLLGES